MSDWFQVQTAAGTLRASVLRLRQDRTLTGEQCVAVVDGSQLRLYRYNGEPLSDASLRTLVQLLAMPLSRLTQAALARYLSDEDALSLLRSVSESGSGGPIQAWKLYERHDLTLQLAKDMELCVPFATEHRLPGRVTVAIGTNGVYIYRESLAAAGLPADSARLLIVSPRDVASGALDAMLVRRDALEARAIFGINARELFNIIPGGRN